MPFTHYNLPLVKKALSLSSGKYLATLSCPDLILQPQELRQVFGESIDKAADRPDTQSIIGWHKAHSLMDGSTVKDTWDAFEGIGVHLTAFDIFPGRGRETLHDLSTPIPVDYHNRFDVLFDCIANQCFDMARVMRNCLEIVRDGGYIVHCLPLTMANQGSPPCSGTSTKTTVPRFSNTTSWSAFTESPVGWSSTRTRA